MSAACTRARAREGAAPVAKKTPQARAAASEAYHRAQIQAAYESGVQDAPLQAAVRWLYAALAQRARDLGPAAAAAMYDHVTHEIAKQAVSVGSRVPTATATGGT
jgi:hypothetical protein